MASAKQVKRVGVLFLLIFILAYILITQFLMKVYLQPTSEENKIIEQEQIRQSFHRKQSQPVNKTCLRPCKSRDQTAATPCNCSITELLKTAKPLSSDNYTAKYPFLLQCRTSFHAIYSTKTNESLSSINYENLTEAANSTHQLRILRAILVYFPITGIEYFENEFRLY
jgi:hypothetical protein